MKQRTNLQQVEGRKTFASTGRLALLMCFRFDLQPKINKILKSLEERALVKSIKSVQNASRKAGLLLCWLGACS
jgi:hypothetical protein